MTKDKITVELLDELKLKPLPTFGFLEPPKPRDGDFLSTLHEWGSLPEIIPVLDAARLLATLCKQNPAALIKVLEKAILDFDIEFWGLSHDGGWRKDMVRMFHKRQGKPKIRPETNTEPAQASFQFEKTARLHVEAMGINLADAVALLRKRGRKVPDELSSLVRTEPANDTVTPAPVGTVSASNSTTPDPERRLARLRVLGGNAAYKRGEWKIAGISALVASEKSEGRKRSDEKTIRADLKEAAENEREAKRANAFFGLGQR